MLLQMFERRMNFMFCEKYFLLVLCSVEMVVTMHSTRDNFDIITGAIND